MAITFPRCLKFAAVWNILRLCAVNPYSGCPQSLRVSLDWKTDCVVFLSAEEESWSAAPHSHEGRHTAHSYQSRGSEHSVLYKEDWSWRCLRGKLGYFWCFWQTSFIKDFSGPVSPLSRSFLFKNCRTENGNIKQKEKLGEIKVKHCSRFIRTKISDLSEN